MKRKIAYRFGAKLIYVNEVNNDITPSKRQTKPHVNCHCKKKKRKRLKNNSNNVERGKNKQSSFLFLG